MSRICQSDNYSANFGYCLRSSSIFYIPPLPIKTYIVVSNYWSFKNNVKELFILVNWRSMGGALVRRESVSFQEGNIAILSPPGDFHGSCEVEAFSACNLRIPYSAIMGVYETESSITMVHSYSRTYSQIEVEDGRTISDGHEGCWILRDSDNVRSFAVFHNGPDLQPSQEITLTVTNSSGISRIVQWTEKEMSPFETRKIYPDQHLSDLTEFLGEQEGTCTIDYRLNKSFTRLLLGWESINQSQLQVTHSNFNYSRHETDCVEVSQALACMAIPSLENSKISVLIYPDRSPGEYVASSNESEYQVLPNTLAKLQGKPGDCLRFRKLDGKLPTRIVTAIQLTPENCTDTLPCECSLGVLHTLRPPKRFHWGIWSAKFNSKLLVTCYPDIYGEPGDSKLTLRFYGENTTELASQDISWKDISKDGRNASICLSSICPTEQLKQGLFGYISIWSEYGGFQAFTTLSKGSSMTLEHTF